MSEVEEVVGGRIHLIPPKGLLSDMKPVILEKLDGGEPKYIPRNFIMPSNKRRFEVEVVVDDSCEICPTAVEAVSELARFENVDVRIYNITYVKPPFEPVTATPAFRINGKVRFTGIPLDPDNIAKYFASFLKEAYVTTHPNLPELVEKLRRFGEAHKLKRNPNDTAYFNLIYKLLKNMDDYGHPYCPCRPLKLPEGATPEQIYRMNADKVCPCRYALTDVKARGTCLCGLFWSEEKVDEYVRKRLEEYGWLIKEIENIQRGLEELKKRVVSGKGKELAETLINRLQEVYVYIPE